jgi:Zn-dependent peptidase ImmA (M78 family)
LDVLSLEDYLFGYKLAIDDSLVGTNIEGYTDFFGKAFYIPLKTYDSLVQGYNNNRERFTTTHEAGHIILHRKMFENKSMMAARTSRGKIAFYMDPEWQANAAAAALLMPLPAFYYEYKKIEPSEFCYFSNIQNLAAKFQVSTDAVSIRINTLSNKGVKNLIKRLGL